MAGFAGGVSRGRQAGSAHACTGAAVLLGYTWTLSLPGDGKEELPWLSARRVGASEKVSLRAASTASRTLDRLGYGHAVGVEDVGAVEFGAQTVEIAAVAGTMTDAALLDEINRLLAIKMQASEVEYSARWPEIHKYIEHALQNAEHNPDYKRPEGDAHELDQFLKEVVLSWPALSI